MELNWTITTKLNMIQHITTECCQVFFVMYMFVETVRVHLLQSKLKIMHTSPLQS